MFVKSMMFEYLVVIYIVHDANIQLYFYIASDIFKKVKILLHRILFRLWFRKRRDCSFDECSQIIPVIHIADVEVVLGTVIRRTKDDFLQEGAPGLRHLYIEVVVASFSRQSHRRPSTGR